MLCPLFVAYAVRNGQRVALAHFVLPHLLDSPPGARPDTSPGNVSWRDDNLKLSCFGGDRYRYGRPSNSSNNSQAKGWKKDMEFEDVEICHGIRRFAFLQRKWPPATSIRSSYFSIYLPGSK